jgi:hypothetical protein
MIRDADDKVSVGDFMLLENLFARQSGCFVPAASGSWSRGMIVGGGCIFVEDGE